MELEHTKLTIWQQNINKSPAGQHDIISSKGLIDMDVNIIALQEPAINQFGKTIATKDWITVYPSTHDEHPRDTRSVLLIRNTLTTNCWKQLDFPSGDVTVVQFKGDWGKITLFNVYNDCQHNRTVNQLTSYRQLHAAELDDPTSNRAHCLWLGDFNRHHPHWDSPEDTRLFTNEAISAAEVLIDAVAEAGLEMTLPSGTPTHCHLATKKWSRLDQVFFLLE